MGLLSQRTLNSSSIALSRAAIKVLIPKPNGLYWDLTPFEVSWHLSNLPLLKTPSSSATLALLLSLGKCHHSVISSVAVSFLCPKKKKKSLKIGAGQVGMGYLVDGVADVSLSPLLSSSPILLLFLHVPVFRDSRKWRITEDCGPVSVIGWGEGAFIVWWWCPVKSALAVTC